MISVPEVKVLVDAGKATASAPLGPALGPLGVNIGDIVNEINEKTKDFTGMKIPVKIDVDSGTKDFKISVGSPPTSAMIKKELGLQKASGNPKADLVGNMTIEQAIKVARMKRDSLVATTLKAALKEIAGSCDSMGIKVDGKKARLAQAAIANGEYDRLLEEKGAAKADPPTPKEEGKMPVREKAEAEEAVPEAEGKTPAEESEMPPAGVSSGAEGTPESAEPEEAKAGDEKK